MYGLTEYLPDYEGLLRLSLFLAVLIALALWEALQPRRPRKIPRTRRWPANFVIGALDVLLVRALLPLGAAAFAVLMDRHGFGLLNVISVPSWAAAAGAVVFLDLVIYTQHVVLHKVPLLWRIHRMHHTDQELDVSSGVRFHPFEIGLSMLIKLAAIALSGAPPEAVLLFEIVLNATSMFSHANLRLPAPLDALLRRIIVTPDMHRIHHSARSPETNSNYGFNLSCWDRLFGTYCAQPRDGHLAMRIGLEEFREPRELSLVGLLTQPFRRPR